MPVTETHDIDPEVYARRWKTLGVLCLSLMIVMVGNASLNIALPMLARDLDASTSALQWIVDAYALVFAGLLFPAGAIGDRFGRKRTLQGGLIVLLLGAALAITADGAGALIAARAVMGAGAAFVMPSTLSSLTSVFPAEERGKAIATWAGVAAGGGAFGPVGSGLLLEHFWWGSVFLMNVPLVVAALVLGHRLVPESKNPAGEPLDATGAGLAMVAVTALVYGIIQGPEHGWSAGPTLLAFAIAGVAGGLFIRREQTARHPMLDLHLFRDRRFSVASAGIAFAFFAMFGTWFLVAQYVQLVLGYSPLKAGVLVLPFPAIMFVLAPRAPRLVARLGSPTVAALGLSAIAVGLVGLSRLGTGSPAIAIYAALGPMAVGMAITGAPLTTLIMSAVPFGKAGVGSAMNDTTRELGGALGVAVLGSLTTTRFASTLEPALTDLPATARDVAASGLPGALRVAAELPGPAADVFAAASRAAFVDAFSVAALAAAIVVLATAGAALALIPRGAPSADPEDERPASGPEPRLASLGSGATATRI